MIDGETASGPGLDAEHQGDTIWTPAKYHRFVRASVVTNFLEDSVDIISCRVASTKASIRANKEW